LILTLAIAVNFDPGKIMTQRLPGMVLPLHDFAVKFPQQHGPASPQP
jgi:hypothetical protein